MEHALWYMWYSLVQQLRDHWAKYAIAILIALLLFGCQTTAPRCDSEEWSAKSCAYLDRVYGNRPWFEED